MDHREFIKQQSTVLDVLENIVKKAEAFRFENRNATSETVCKCVCVQLSLRVQSIYYVYSVNGLCAVTRIKPNTISIIING